jgi:Rps23 Pro-64 3,4-dihydroxylase Tpa1-like proline 4-hydroxylase
VLIESTVQDRAAELRHQFESNQPFRHVVIDNFLDPEFCRQLIADFPVFDAAKARNELGEVGRKAVITNLPKLGPAYARFDQMMRSREFLSFVGGITGIPKLLYDPEYVGGGTHENLSGQDLDNHVDFNYHPNSRLHRRLNLIVFLNPEWEPEWGGCLELHRNPWLPEQASDMRSVVPLANRAVIFETSERSWHGFKRIEIPAEKAHISRRSIAVYFYSRRRPPEETAVSHSTVYVQRALPEHIQPGYTLAEADVQAIQNLLTRRDHQIQMLYKREKIFSATISAMAESGAFRLIRMLTSPWRLMWRTWHIVRHGK